MVVEEKRLVCPDCASRQLLRMGKRTRQLCTVPIGLKPPTIVAEEQCCRCKDCGRLFAVSPFIQRLARSFADYTEGILSHRKHRSSSGTQEDLNHQIKTMCARPLTCAVKAAACSGCMHCIKHTPSSSVKRNS